MHEWSLAEAILDALTSLMEQESMKKISEVEILYGEMMELELDILKFALEELSKETPMKDTKFIFSEERASFRCNSCGYRWNFEQAHSSMSEELGIRELTGERESPIHFIPELAQALMRCPNCGSRDFEIESGKGIRISRIVFEG
jgi:hydrogenase nickel incorporation protein HypA/HybF